MSTAGSSRASWGLRSVLGAWGRVLPGLANGKSSVLTGLCWGLPRQGAGGCSRPPSDDRVVQLGVGHVLGGFGRGSLCGEGRCVRWGAWGPGEEGPICCASVHPSRNPPDQENRGGASCLCDLGGSQGARPLLGPASRLLCWRETVRQDRRLLGPPPSSNQLPTVPR